MNQKVLAHRGFSSRYPENTMAAFRAALECGADGVEFDVQLSGDGVPVIIHDESLRRTAGIDRAVEDCDLSELRAADVSGAFREETGPQPVPTLEEYFDLVRDRAFLSDIELKTGIREYPGIERRVVEMIRAFRLEDRVLFSSFNHYSMLRCREIAPEIPCGLLYDCRIAYPHRYARSLGVQYLHPWHVLLTPEELRTQEGEEGVPNNPWTVDDPDRMRVLLDSPAVYCLITNKPDLALRVRAERDGEAGR